MIIVYPYASLGNANYGWLNAHYHFSFSSYHNPKRMGFGALRVINDDIVAAGTGFDTHPHQNMEIITYIKQGAISHKDTMGNEGRTKAGDVQVMSAGSGLAHSEFNHEREDTKLYQIWITPHTRNVTPRWDSKQFPKTYATNQLSLLVSGRPEHQNSDALKIHQHAAIYGGNMRKGTSLMHSIIDQAYILASKGSFKLNDTLLNEGDGAEITDLDEITVTALSDAEILVIDVPNA